MKIGLVTYFRENYGSALQCFATKYYIEKLGYEVIVLEKSIDSECKIWKRFLNLLKHASKSIKYKGYFRHYYELKTAMKKEKSTLTEDDLQGINSFIKENLQPMGLTWNKLCSLSKKNEFVGFVCGSDQIWNPSIGIIDPIFFLGFCQKEKRIAFAPSFGTDNVPNFNVIDLQNGLKGFERLSVREETGVDIISELIGVSCTRLPDPVFLLRKDQWLELVKERQYYNDSYALLYFLNEPSKLAIKTINEECNYHKYIPLVFSHHHERYNEISGVAYSSGDPLDFINLVSHAQIVYTDSYHATVFSLILERKFLCFERQYLHKLGQGNRITNLLKRFGIPLRYITSNNSSGINWDYDVKSLSDITQTEHKIVIQYLTEELNRVSGVLR